MDNLEIYNKYRSVPQEAQKKITGGRINGFTDINSMWRIKCLTEQFGPCGIGWYIEVTDKQIESYGEETAVFVDINLYVKADGEWSKPIYGNGGSRFVTKERNGAYVSDECYKMAVTDAISVACKMLGIGADIYWADDRTKYNQKQSETPSSKTSANTPIGQMDAKYLNSLKSEMDKKFVNADKILGRYTVTALEELTFSQYQSCMKSLEKTKPPINPPEIPDNVDDPELPWNQPSPLEAKPKKKSKREQADELYDQLMESEKFS